MPTERRDYDDAYTTRFRAPIVRRGSHEGRPAVEVASTYFYPESGGQEADRGTLGPWTVGDVQVDDDGCVWHVIGDAGSPEAGPGAPDAGSEVEGAIDWARRFDHMQQHSGQHILSRAFIQIAGADTIGFHLGDETVSIDLDASDLSDARIAEAEQLANEILNANLAVRAWFPEPDELAALPLRKRPEVAGAVRVVAIGDFDLNACGGTHVAATGEIGLIAVLGSERLKRGTRIEFLCGGRARTDYRRKHALVRDLARTFTCAPAELGDAITRMREGFQEARRELAGFHEQELAAEAARLGAGATPRGALRLVRAAWEGRPIEELRGLALRLTEPAGVVALLGLAGERSQLVFAKSEQVGLDLNPWFRRVLETLGDGRGGGARILQGTAGPASLARMESLLEEVAAGLDSSV